VLQWYDRHRAYIWFKRRRNFEVVKKIANLPIAVSEIKKKCKNDL